MKVKLEASIFVLISHVVAGTMVAEDNNDVIDTWMTSYHYLMSWLSLAAGLVHAAVRVKTGEDWGRDYGT